MRRFVITLALLATAGFGYNLLTQSFDSVGWTPNAPPGGWRIFHSDTANVGDDDWHRDSARAPWTGHPTPFAAILPSATRDSSPDSLISPIIDCRGYKQVTLCCSTDFLPVAPGPYAAQIVYSVDSGVTFPYTVQTYDTVTGTVYESLLLSAARDRAGLVIAWVFSGDIDSLTSWYVDDVDVTAESLYLWDIQAGLILVPDSSVLRTGLMTPTCRFRNFGDTIQYAIPVACSLYDGLGNGLAGWYDSIDSLPGNGTETVSVFTPAYDVTPGDYSIKFWCYADSDYNRANDTNSRTFQALDLYDMATTAVVTPGVRMRTGPLTPSARFRNFGDTVQYFVPVVCTLYDTTMAVVASWRDTVDSISVAAETLFSFTPAFNINPGNYYIRFWCSADSDYNRANDTISRGFQVTNPPDMAATAIVTPDSAIRSGPLTPSARFRNLGDTTQYFVPVACTLYDTAMAVVASWRDTVDSVSIAAETLVSFTPAFNIDPGNYYIRFWCSADSDYNRANDTVGRAFSVVHLYDMATTAIVTPVARMRTGPLTPSARFRNLGDTIQYFVPVACTLYDTAMSVVANWQDTIDSVPIAAETLFSFTPAFNINPGNYYIRFWCSADSDYNRANDTIGRNFMVVYLYDIAARRIIVPDSGVIRTGSMAPACRFRNAGDTIQYAIPVACSLYDNLGTGLSGWYDSIDSLPGGARETVSFFSPPYSITPGNYSIKFWCYADSDSYRANDTNSRNFRAVDLYDMAATAIVSPAGGFIPPGLLTPSARFRNLGDTIQYAVPVSCTLYDSLMAVVASWSAAVDSVLPATETLLFAFAPPFDLSIGSYYIRFRCAADSDYQRVNDTIGMAFSVVNPWDIAATAIVTPGRPIIRPGPLSPAARFSNRGDSSQYFIPVACSLFDNLMNGLAAWTDTIDSLPTTMRETVVTFGPSFTIPTGDYYIRFWSAADSDYTRANDTIGMPFRASYLDYGYYDDGVVESYHDWPVGHNGWGARFTTAWPAYLESVQVYLSAPIDPVQCRYQLAVFLDDGTGRPGSLYYRTPVLFANPGTAGWQSVFIADTGQKMVMNADIHVFYLQVGEPPECPQLGRDSTRTPGAPYWRLRKGVFLADSTDGDYMIRAVLNGTPFTPPNTDVRPLALAFPTYDFVQRPFDAPVVPVARLQNSGVQGVANAMLECTVIGPGSVIYYTGYAGPFILPPGADTLATFAAFWVPDRAEQCTVQLRAYLAGAPGPDDIPENDVKRYTVDVVKGAHTGRSLLAYNWIDSDTLTGPVFAWIDTNDCGILNLRDEDRMNIPLYFNFPYYDTTYNYVYASANGWFGLGVFNPGGTNDSTPRVLPDTMRPNLAVYLWWDNLAMGPGFSRGYMFYKTIGLAPNRQFVLIWENVTRVGSDSADPITFEVILNENGTIVCQYKDVTTGDLAFDDARYAAIGLEGPNGTDGLCYLYDRPPLSTSVNGLANRVHDSSAIMFYREKRDAAAVRIVNPRVYDFPGIIQPRALIQNYGTVYDTIWSFMTIDNVRFDSVMLPGLNRGESTVVAFRDWDARMGVHTLRCSVYMRDDADSSNNVTSTLVIISSWAMREEIPYGPYRRRVKEAALCYVPIDGKLYALKGANSNEFWSFDLTTRVWDTMPEMPRDPSGSRTKDGCDLAYDPFFGLRGRIWAIKGGGRPDFYFFHLDSNKWVTRRSAVPRDTTGVRRYRAPKKGAAIAYSSDLGPLGTVFCIPGNSSLDFWYYDINSDTWAYGPDVPRGQRGIRCKYGSDLTYGNQHVYLLKGTNTLEAYAYDVLGDSWDYPPGLNPTGFLGPRYRTVKNGASMTYFAGNNRLYALKGGNKTEFWNYHLDGDSWVQCTDIPLAIYGRKTKIKRGSSLEAVDSTIYCLKGSYSMEFWEYKPGTDTAGLFSAVKRPQREGVMELAHLDLRQPFLQIYPNPTRAGLNIAYNLVAPGNTRLYIYDAAGKLVANLANAPRDRGKHVARWSGRGLDGRMAPAGVYFVDLVSGEVRLTRKLVIQN